MLTSSFSCVCHITEQTSLYITALIASFWVSDLLLLITGLMFSPYFLLCDRQFLQRSIISVSLYSVMKKYDFAPHVDQQYNLSMDLKTFSSFQIHLMIMSYLSPLLELILSIFEGSK